ncbi:CGP-CTERM sorting domain-containing protein [Thermococcus sp. JCM 11816]
MMEKVPERVEVKYNVEEKTGSTCGPAFLVGLAVVPLLLRRRK